jgi:hypothetical protein
MGEDHLDETFGGPGLLEVVEEVGFKFGGGDGAVDLKTLLHWFAHNYITEFDGIDLWCKYYFLHIIFRKNYARDTCVI